MATIVVLVCLAASFNLASSAGLHTTLTYSGSYQININNRPWFTSQETYVVSGGIRYGNNGSVVIFHGEVPAVDKPLLLKSAMLDKDHDALGDFQRMRYEYFAGLTKVDMDIRAYDDMVVFTQTFPEGLTNVQVPDERKTLTGFPALHWEIVFAGSTADGYLTFSGELRGDDSVSIGKWPPFDHYKLPPDGMDASGPLCLFNTTGRDAVVISPLTQVMAVSPWHHQWKIQDPFPITEAQSYWGLDRDLVHVPAGFKVEVILVYSPDGVGKVDTQAQDNRCENE